MWWSISFQSRTAFLTGIKSDANRSPPMPIRIDFKTCVNIHTFQKKVAQNEGNVGGTGIVELSSAEPRSRPVLDFMNPAQPGSLTTRDYLLHPDKPSGNVLPFSLGRNILHVPCISYGHTLRHPYSAQPLKRYRNLCTPCLSLWN